MALRWLVVILRCDRQLSLRLSLVNVLNPSRFGARTRKDIQLQLGQLFSGRCNQAPLPESRGMAILRSLLGMPSRINASKRPAPLIQKLACLLNGTAVPTRSPHSPQSDQPHVVLVE